MNHCGDVWGKLQSADLSGEVIRSPLIEFDKMEVDLGFDWAWLFDHGSDRDDRRAFLAF